MLIDEAQLNLGHKARVAKWVYTLIKSVMRNKVSFFPKLKMFYLKNNSFQLIGKMSIRLMGLTKLTNSVGKNL